MLARVWPPLDRWLDPAVDDRLIATAVDLLEEEADRA
jgi:hypothetical protein